MTTTTPPPAPPPPLEVGLTDQIDRLLGARIDPRVARALALVDDNAGVRVDADGVELRRVLRNQRVRWDDVDRVVLESRLDVGLAFATRFLPVRRVPVVGGLLVDAAEDAAGALTRRLLPDVRRRAGWVVATLHRSKLLRRDVEVDGAPALAALLAPAVADAVVAHAEARGITVERR